ncbi:MAG: SMI1/KNR4 family protein [Polyangiaceae bacterium]|nr:SMI1/KNR4 family protein [Polyangiaceae bacterium]
MDIIVIVEHLRNQCLSPKNVTFRGESMPFKLRCVLESHGAQEAVVSRLSTSLPRDLAEFWRVCESARLFEDTSFGQWGLEILGPSESLLLTEVYKQTRSHDFVKGDLIIGKFIGDSELLLIRCDLEAADFGSLLIVAPLDLRSDWIIVAISFREFLTRYVAAQGDKYWELSDCPPRP